MYKFQNNILSLSISQLYARNFSIHNHSTRNKDFLRIPQVTKTFSNVSALACMEYSYKQNILAVLFPSLIIICKCILLHNFLTLTYSE